MKTRLLDSLQGSKLAALGAITMALLMSSTSLADNITATNVGDSFINISDNETVTSTVTITESEIIESARFSIEGLQHLSLIHI